MINQEKQEQLKNKAYFLDTIHVAGVTFVKGGQEFLQQLSRNWEVWKTQCDIVLVREPDNQFDTNAIKVNLFSLRTGKSKPIGYIPKDKNELYAYILDNKECGYTIEINTELSEIVNTKGGNYGFWFYATIAPGEEQHG